LHLPESQFDAGGEPDHGQKISFYNGIIDNGFIAGVSFSVRDTEFQLPAEGSLEFKSMSSKAYEF
jgi:hypothetical protein